MNTGQFKKGNIPWNKGLKGFNPSPETQFKLGNRPRNTVPVGSEVESKGYIRVKIGEPNVWRPRSHIIWEENHGCSLPDGWIIRRKDGNPLNDDPNNLIAMPRSRNLAKTLEGPNILARQKKNNSKAQQKRWQEYRLSQYDIYYWQSEEELF